MPDQRRTSQTTDDAERIHRALLQILITSHPVPLSIEEVQEELGDDHETVTRAIQDLVSLGVARRGKMFVLASKSAVHTARLL